MDLTDRGTSWPEKGGQDASEGWPNQQNRPAQDRPERKAQVCGLTARVGQV